MTGAVVIEGRRERAPAPRMLSTLEARAFIAWRRAGLDSAAAADQLAAELESEPALRRLVAAETIDTITRSRRSTARAFAQRAEGIDS